MLQGLARALATVRDRHGRSPSEAVDALLAALQNADSAGSVWDDSGMVAAHLEALGQIVPASPEVSRGTSAETESFEFADSTGSAWDESGVVAAHLEALGQMAPATSRCVLSYAPPVID